MIGRVSAAMTQSLASLPNHVVGLLQAHLVMGVEDADSNKGQGYGCRPEALPVLLQLIRRLKSSVSTLAFIHLDGLGGS